jgi:hypothetical protein
MIMIMMSASIIPPTVIFQSTTRHLYVMHQDLRS